MKQLQKMLEDYSEASGTVSLPVNALSKTADTPVKKTVNPQADKPCYQCGEDHKPAKYRLNQAHA